VQDGVFLREAEQLQRYDHRVCVFSCKFNAFNNNKNIEIIHAHAQKWPILIWPLIIVLGLCMNISRKIVLAIISVDLSRFARKVEIALPAPS
jgi:hypothetical protein